MNALLALARDRSTEGRSRLVAVVGDLFLDTGKVLSDRERALMGGILNALVRDIEMSVRRRLADRLATVANVPHELIKTLANSEAEVAQPILMKSKVLLDADLVEVIQHRTLRHQLAITMRESLSATVSEALVETGNSAVIKSLLENENAEISEATMAFLVEESRSVDGFRNPLVHRKDLDPALAKRMYWWVSAALRKHILETYELDPTDLDDAIEETVQGLLADPGGDDGAIRQAERLSKILGKEDGIDAKRLIGCLREGQVALFETMLAEFAKLPPTLIRRFIYEPGGDGLAITAKALGIEKSDLGTIFLLSRGARPDEQVVDPQELSSVMAFYDRVDATAARKVVRRWRRDPDFLLALKQVDPK